MVTLVANMLIGTVLVVWAWVLWRRHGTWASRWARPVTINLLLQGVLVLCAWPAVASVPGELLYSLTGLWNLQLLLGHISCVLALAAVAAAVVSRLGHAVDQTRLARLIGYPVTVAVPVMVALLLNSSVVHTKIRVADLHMPPDVWSGLYWVVLIAVGVHLARIAVSGLWVLRRCPVYEPVANLYLGGFVLITINAVLHLIPVLFPGLHRVGLCPHTMFGVLSVGALTAFLLPHTPVVGRVTVRRRVPESPGSPEDL